MTTITNSRDMTTQDFVWKSTTAADALGVGPEGFVSGATTALDHSAFDFGLVGFETEITTIANALNTGLVGFVPDTAAADSGITGGGGGGDLVSREALGTVEVVLACGFTISVILVGIPGNVLSLLVFGKQGLGDRVNILLFSLDVANLINITTLLLVKSTCFIKLFDPTDAANWAVITALQIVNLNRWANFVACFLMVIMAVDRCISVVFPLKASRILTYRRMLAAIVTVYLVVLASYAPSMFLYTVQWTLDPTTNRSMAVPTIADHFVVDRDLPLHIAMSFNLIIKPASVGLVVICTIITVVKLKQAMKRRHQMTSDDRSHLSQSETRITTMLIVLSAIYLVLVLPEIAAGLTNVLVPEFFFYRKYHNTFTLVFLVDQAASALNSSVNFFAYFLLSSRFRETLAGMLPCIKPLLQDRADQHHYGSNLQHSI